MRKQQQRFFNREVSWVEFNARVMDESRRSEVPLLERLRFLTIVTTNFDEFFMVRVGSLKEQARTNPEWRDVSGLTAREQLLAIASRVHEIVGLQYDCLMNEILPGLSREGLEYVGPDSFTGAQLRYLDTFFLSEVHPLLTPLRTRDGEPLPSIANLRLHAAFSLERSTHGENRDSTTGQNARVQSFLEMTGAAIPETGVEGTAQNCATGEERLVKDDDPLLAIVQIPASVSRIVWLPSDGERKRFTLLDDVVRTFGQRLFPGFAIRESLLFKIARNADFVVDEEREVDFITAMQEVLESRLTSVPVRLVCSTGSTRIVSCLARCMGLDEKDVYEVSGPIDLSTLIELVNAEGFAHLRYPVWKHFWPAAIPADTALWDALKRGDLFLHAPYHSWDPVLKFINDAADDPMVLAIKMTLYRTSGDSPVIKALERAARAGKHVTVFVELKARFDEERNISWAHRLENVGVIVVYGIARLKVHAKILMIVRRENDGVRRYVHLSTGNYNDRTARYYTDLSLFTANEDMANDATLFFNMVSGYSSVLHTRLLVMAPIDLKSRLISLIDREIQRSSRENPGLIQAKMNSLADPEIIEALYRASQAGVRVMLNVRGICMLVPAVTGMSENITVISIIDRFLEHERIFLFGNSGANEVYLASSDWMPRNLDRRIELMFPVIQDDIRRSIITILECYFRDNTNSHELCANGAWNRRSPAKGSERFRVQEYFYEQEKRLKELQEKEPPREFMVRRN